LLPWLYRRLQSPIRPQIYPAPPSIGRIEVTVRSQFSIPQDYNLAIGARKPSTISGMTICPSPSAMAPSRK